MQLWQRSGNYKNMWHREMLTINATHSSIDFQIVFKATIGSYYEGDIAIDDVVFTPECRYIALYKKNNNSSYILFCRPKQSPSSTSSPSPSPNNCDGQFQCPSGDCIDLTKVCDFHYDCPDSTSDEDGCPSIYNFENCATLEECKMQEEVNDHLDFIVTTGITLL